MVFIAVSYTHLDVYKRHAYNDVLEALDFMGLDFATLSKNGISLYKVAMPWPLEPQGVLEFAKGHETLLVVEHKRPLIENQVKNILYDNIDGKRPKVLSLIHI